MELSSSESPFCFPSRRDLDFRAPGLPELAGCGPPLSGHHFSTTCLKLPVVLREKSRNFSDTQIRNSPVELRGSLGTAPYATTARLTGQYLCLLRLQSRATEPVPFHREEIPHALEMGT